MCYNCGCGVPTDNMGDKNNITEGMLEEHAKSKKIDLSELKIDLLNKLEKDPQNIRPDYEKMFKTAADSWGQSVEEAKKEALSLLKKQLKK